MKLTIFDIENWKEIGATLSRNKTRTFLTGFGIFWGTAMLAILLGGARGAQDMLMQNFDGFATNSGAIFSQRTTKPYKGYQKGRWWDLDVTDIERIRLNFPEFETVTELLNNGGVRFESDRYSYSGTAMGVAPEFNDVMTPVIYSGRFINENDMSRKRKAAVVGRKVANELYPGNPSPIGEKIKINGIVYTIVGIAGQNSEISLGGRIDESVLLPGPVFRQAFKRNDNVDVIMFVGKNGVKISELKDRLRHVVYQRHNIASDDENAMNIFDVSEMFDMVNNLFLGLSLLALFIGSSTLMAGIIGIGNIMWVIVKERTQEIGIRRAIGAKPRDIIMQILSEGMMLTSAAGSAGICFAAVVLGIAQAITSNDISSPRFQMNPEHALMIMTTFIVLGTAAGMIPSIKAMKIKPVEALNDK